MRPAALATLALLLAGCASHAGGDDGVHLGDGSMVALKDVAVGEATGSITGVVVDEAIRPVAGANVTGQGTAATRTDAQGLFTLAGLQPGLHTLRVNATGFLAVQSTAEVKAGEVAKVRVVLPADLTPKPYHTTLKFDAYDEVGQGTVDFAIDLVARDFANGTIPPQCDRCYFYFQADSKPATILIEAAWTDSVPDLAENATEYYWSLDGLDSGDYTSDYCYSPCHAPVPGDTLPKDLSFGLSISPDEDWVTYEQEWQVFVTLFYREPAPAGWSFINGDE
jgi:hypothetical protein